MICQNSWGTCLLSTAQIPRRMASPYGSGHGCALPLPLLRVRWGHWAGYWVARNLHSQAVATRFSVSQPAAWLVSQVYALPQSQPDSAPRLTLRSWILGRLGRLGYCATLRLRLRGLALPRLTRAFFSFVWELANHAPVDSLH